MLPYTPYAMAMPGWQGKPTWLESPSGYVDQDGNPIPVITIATEPGIAMAILRHRFRFVNSGGV
jgi:hypothetical protein